MTRGGSRNGAGRPSTLNEFERLSVAWQCEVELAALREANVTEAIAKDREHMQEHYTDFVSFQNKNKSTPVAKRAALIERIGKAKQAAQAALIEGIDNPEPWIEMQEAHKDLHDAFKEQCEVVGVDINEQPNSFFESKRVFRIWVERPKEGPHVRNPNLSAILSKVREIVQSNHPDKRITNRLVQRCWKEWREMERERNQSLDDSV